MNINKVLRKKMSVRMISANYVCFFATDCTTQINRLNKGTRTGRRSGDKGKNLSLEIMFNKEIYFESSPAGREARGTNARL